MHYRRAEPKADLFAHLLEGNPEMACAVAKELTAKLADTQDKITELKQDLSKSTTVTLDLANALKATEKSMQELSKDLTANITKQLDAAISGIKKSLWHNDPEGLQKPS